ARRHRQRHQWRRGIRLRPSHRPPAATALLPGVLQLQSIDNPPFLLADVDADLVTAEPRVDLPENIVKLSDRFLRKGWIALGRGKRHLPVGSPDYVAHRDWLLPENRAPTRQEAPQPISLGIVLVPGEQRAGCVREAHTDVEAC